MKEQGRKEKQNSKAVLKRIFVILFWLLVWQLVALCVGNRILLAGPWETLVAWIMRVQEREFLLTCLFSMGRIGLGILLGFSAGVLLGILGYRFRGAEELLAPLMTFFKSVPVAAVTVLLLIWWGSKGLSVAVVFIVVLPLVYVNTLQGLRAASPELLEMAQVFRMPLWNRIFYIYRPALRPFMDSCLGIALGMSWKSGVAAEVIGTPDFSIGEQMYMSKIYMDTAGLFAWTATVIVLSFLFEKAGIFLWKAFCLWKPGFGGGKRGIVKEKQGQRASDETRSSEKVACLEGGLQLVNLNKSYGEKQVLTDINKNLEPGKIYCLMAPSGAGKTTLLRILAGAERSDGSEMMRDEARKLLCSMCFQENRLAEHLNSVENILLVAGGGRRREVTAQLQMLLPADSLEKPCSLLSGGMKRRVSLVRAMMAAGVCVLLDEPFAGLDEENKEKAIAYILGQQRGRCIIIATHDEADAEKLGAEVWRMTGNYG